MKDIFKPKASSKVRSNNIIVQRFKTTKNGTKNLKYLGQRIQNIKHLFRILTNISKFGLVQNVGAVSVQISNYFSLQVFRKFFITIDTFFQKLYLTPNRYRVHVRLCNVIAIQNLFEYIAATFYLNHVYAVATRFHNYFILLFLLRLFSSLFCPFQGRDLLGDE